MINKYKFDNHDSTGDIFWVWIEVVCRERHKELMWKTWGMKNHHEATLVCGYINSEPLTCLEMIVMLEKKLQT